MKQIPFPYALNIGTDIVHLPRITRLLTSRPNYLSRFTQRILSEAEQRDFHRRFKGITQISPSQNTSETAPNFTIASISASARSPPITPEITRWLAGRFAAKEAARKASPAGAASIGWKDVIVRVEEDERKSTASTGGVVGGHTAADGTSRRPEIIYVGGGEERVARLSISHDGDYVVATVLAAG
jgi:holo-[acyl-carrier protein] synthase